MNRQFTSSLRINAARDQRGPLPEAELLDRLLPRHVYYFELEPASDVFLASPGWRTAFGYDNACTTVSAWLDTMPLSDRGQVQQALAQLVTGKIARYDAHIRMADARGVAVDAEITLLTGAASEGALRVHGLQRSVSEAGAADGLTTHLVHQLANDLASIEGYGAMLKSDPLTPDQQGHLDEILHVARRLAQRVNGGHAGLPAPHDADLPARVGDALGIDTVEAGAGAALDCEPDTLIDMLRPLLARRRRHAGASAGFSIHWRTKPRGRRLACASCHSVFAVEAFIAVSLCDEGIPIDRELLTMFLRPGFDAVSIRPADDTAVCDGVGDAMDALHRLGGHVTLQSSTDQTALEVYLPLSCDSDAPASPVAGHRILVVDDNMAVARFIETLLTSEGYEVATVSNPAEALARFQTSGSKFDLVISDATMPGMSGIAMLRRMCRQNPQLRVVVCTGLVDVDGLDADWRMVPKPVDKQLLLGKVRGAIGSP